MSREESVLNKMSIFLIFYLIIASWSTVAINFETNQDWKNGSFNATTSENPGSIGDLELGYPDGNTSDSIEAYWRMDGSNLDFSGNNLDPISERNVSYKSGILGGQSAFFSSSNSTYIEYPDSPGLNNQEFTVGSWIYIPQQQQGEAPIVQKDTSESSGFRFLVDNYYANDVVSLFVYSSQSGEQRYRSVETVPKNEWVHLGASLDSSGQVKLYMNGTELSIDSRSSSQPADLDINSNNLLLGATSTQSGGDYFDGRLDEVRIISKAINTSEIKEESLNNFSGEYNYELSSEPGPFLLSNFTASTSLDQQTDLNLTLKSIEDDSVLESQLFDLSNGLESNKVSLKNSSSYRAVVKAKSENPEITPSLQTLDINKKKYNFSVDSITLNVSNPVQNQVLELQTIISSNQKYSATVNTSIKIQKFQEGKWKLIDSFNKSFESSGEDTKTISENFVSDIGPHRINVTVDPNNNIPEIDSNRNNQKLLYFDVPLYAWFYGNVTVERYLGYNGGFYNWTGKDVNGTIYFSDTDAEFSFSNLKPLSDFNDLQKGDDSLNSTGYNDSIAEEWGNAQQINQTGCYLLDGKNQCEVPLALTEEGSRFKTGIVYEGSSGFSSGDPLIFLTGLKQRGKGAFGVNNYEIKVPEPLTRTQGSNELYDIYLEIA